MTMTRNFKFDDFVGPICLPSSPNFFDRPESDEEEDLKAYVAGWGSTFGACDTGSFGPTPHTMCKFPFIFEGRIYNQCSFSPPPSAYNKICKEFFRRNRHINFNDKKEAYKIYFWDKKASLARYTTCYSISGSSHGWCGTCSPGELLPGDEGYCDKYGMDDEKDNYAEMARPTPSFKWGWCNNWCNDPEAKQVSTRR